MRASSEMWKMETSVRQVRPRPPKTRSDAPKTTAAQHSRGDGGTPHRSTRVQPALGHVQQVHVGEDGGGVHRAAAEAEAEAALGHGGEDVA